MYPIITSTTLLSSVMLLASIILPGTSFVITNSPAHLDEESRYIEEIHTSVHEDTNDHTLAIRSRKHNQSLLEKLVQYLHPHDSLAQDNALLAIAIHDTEIAAIKDGGKPGKVIKRSERKSPGSNEGVLDAISAFVMAKGSNGWVTIRRKKNIVKRQDPDDPVGEGDDDYPETGLTDQPDIVDGGNEGGAAATSTVDPGATATVGSAGSAGSAATSDMSSAGDADGGDVSSDGGDDGDDGGNIEPDGSAASTAAPLPSPPTTMLPLPVLTTEVATVAPAAATTTTASLPDYPGSPCVPVSA